MDFCLVADLRVDFLAFAKADFFVCAVADLRLDFGADFARCTDFFEVVLRVVFAGDTFGLADFFSALAVLRAELFG